MKRRFRITITPDDSTISFRGVKDFTAKQWNVDFYSPFTGFINHKDKIGYYYCVGIEKF